MNIDTYTVVSLFVVRTYKVVRTCVQTICISLYNKVCSN